MEHVEITIAGHPFHAPVPYSEGHQLRANEANALNQVFHENLRNNFAKKVKDAKDSGAFDHQALQDSFLEYARNYQFGVRALGGGGASADPVETEALALARGDVRQMLTKSGKKIKDYPKEKLDAAYAAQLEKHRERYIEAARERIRIKQEAASADLSSLDLDQPSPAAPVEPEAKPRRRKSAEAA